MAEYDLSFSIKVANSSAPDVKVATSGMSDDMVKPRRYSIEDLKDQILVGDCGEIAGKFPSEFVRCIVTSPPYFGHRDYTGKTPASGSELGKESSAGEYISRLVSLL